MLHTTIQTTDEATGKELPIPAELHAKVQHAADLLGAQLGGVAAQFDIHADWRLALNPAKRVGAWLRIAIGPDDRGQTRTFPLPASTFADDDTTRQGLYAPLTWIGQELAALVDSNFERIQQRLQQDVESFAITTEV